MDTTSAPQPEDQHCLCLTKCWNAQNACEATGCCRPRPSCSKIRPRSKFLKKTLPGYLILHFLLLAYLVLGAWAFSSIEQPYQDATLHNITSVKKAIAAELESLCLQDHDNLTDVVVQYLEQYDVVLEEAFEQGIQLKMAYKWDMTASVFFCLTILSTIGYGAMVPVTRAGKIVCMLYAAVGIPLFFLYLIKLGQVLSQPVKTLYKKYVRMRSKSTEAAVRWSKRFSSRLSRSSQKTELRREDRDGVVTQKTDSNGHPVDETILMSSQDQVQENGRKGFEEQELEHEHEHEHEREHDRPLELSGGSLYESCEELKELEVKLNKRASENNVWNHDNGQGKNNASDQQDSIEELPDETKSVEHDDPISSSRDISPTQRRIRQRRRRYAKPRRIVRRKPYDKKSKENQNEKIQVSIFWLVFMLVGYILLGALMFVRSDGWSYLDSTYFLVMTFSTVGFGDFVPKYDREHPGRQQLYQTTYLIGGLLIMSTCVNLSQDRIRNLASRLFDESANNPKKKKVNEVRLGKESTQSETQV